jgi:hypothetical protein
LAAVVPLVIPAAKAGVTDVATIAVQVIMLAVLTRHFLNLLNRTEHLLTECFVVLLELLNITISHR